MPLWGKSKISPRKHSVKTTGLDNRPGDNNCFLNSAVQALWHLDVFRTNFERFTGHYCFDESSCIFCALKHLFAKFTYSDKKTLPPTDLRMSLASIYQEEKRFQLGLMDDAAECFENLLIQIHKHLVNSTCDDNCSERHCLPHQKFGMTLVEQGVCSCGEASEPLSYTQLVHYVSANALCARLKERQRHGASAVECAFGKLIRAASVSMRDCPNDCGSKIRTWTTLTNAPDIISIGVSWDSDEPSIEHIRDLIETLNITIRLQDMFDTVLDKKAQRTDYHLSSLVCYYGKHYSAFFYNRKHERWVSIDDATVSDAGKHWRDIANKFAKGHTQPLLLLYTSYEPLPLPTSTAPSTIIRQCPSVHSSPALSLRNSEPAPSSSSSDNGASPSQSINGQGGVRRKFTWGNTVPTRHVGAYKEPKSSNFTVYKPYPNTHSNMLQPTAKRANEYRRGTSFKSIASEPP